MASIQYTSSFSTSEVYRQPKKRKCRIEVQFLGQQAADAVAQVLVQERVNPFQLT